jgi:hypothetical protein
MFKYRWKYEYVCTTSVGITLFSSSRNKDDEERKHLALKQLRTYHESKISKLCIHRQIYFISHSMLKLKTYYFSTQPNYLYNNIKHTEMVRNL